MADLFVQVRMKRCCRAALAALDAARRPLRADRAVGAVATLENELGAQPLPQAFERVCGERPAARRPSELEARVHRLCATHARAHASEHRESGEDAEAAFWERTAALLEAFVAGARLEGGAEPNARGPARPGVLVPANAPPESARGRH